MTRHPHTSPERIAALHAVRDRNKGEASATQRARLLDALQTLGHVTTFEAMRHLDIFDPRPRKLELVRDGHDIVTTRRSVETESGVPHSIGVYTLKRGVSLQNDEAPAGANGQGFKAQTKANSGDSDGCGSALQGEGTP